MLLRTVSWLIFYTNAISFFQICMVTDWKTGKSEACLLKVLFISVVKAVVKPPLAFLNIDSLRTHLYKKLVGKFEFHIRAPLLFVLPVDFLLVDLEVLFWHAQVWVSCHRLCFSPPSIPNSILISVFILRHSVSLSFPRRPFALSALLSVCLLACPLSIQSPVSVSRFPPSFILVSSCWASPSWCKMTTNKKNKKQKRASPRLSPLSSRLELIPRPQSCERGSFVVTCCQSSSYSTPNVYLAAWMTNGPIKCWFHTVITCCQCRVLFMEGAEKKSAVRTGWPSWMNV